MSASEASSGRPSAAPADGRPASILLLLVVAAALGAGALLARSRIHGWDALAYTARAHAHPFLSERYLSTRFYHPHHLLYMPVARAFAALPLPASDPFLPLQALSALGLAAAAFAGGLVVRERRNGWRRPLAATLATGLGYGAWRYGGDVEVMTPALALMLLGVLALARGRGAAGATLAGLALAGGALFHQFVALFWLATLALVVVETAAGRGSVPRLLGFVGGFTIPVAAAYAGAAAASGAFSGVAPFAAWIAGAHGRAQAFASLDGLPSLISLGALGGLTPLDPLRALRWFGPRDPGTVLLALLALAVVALAIAMAVRALPRLAAAVAGGDHLTRALLFGAIAIAAAIGWFQPGNEEYWVYVPPLLALAVAIHLPTGPRVAGATTLLLAGLLALDLAVGWWPRRDPAMASVEPVVRFAREHMSPPDLLVIAAEEPGWEQAPLAVPLLAGVDAIVVSAGAARVAWFDREIGERLAHRDARVLVTPLARDAVLRAAGPGWRMREAARVGDRGVSRLEPGPGAP